MIGRAIQVKNISQNAKNRKGPLSHRKIKCLFWIMFNFWWSAKQSEQKTLTEIQKNKKGPLIIKISNVCLWITFNFWWPARLVNGLKPHLPPLSSPKNEMFIFGLHSTSDDQLSNPSTKHWPKCKKKKQKWPPKSFKNQRFVFALHSTSDDWPSDLSKKCWLKCKKNKKGPLSHWKIKGLFLDYIQLLMISRAIQIKNVNRNYKKPRRPSKSLKNQMFIFGLHSTSDEQLSDLSEKHWLKCKKIKKAP